MTGNWHSKFQVLNTHEGYAVSICIYYTWFYASICWMKWEITQSSDSLEDDYCFFIFLIVVCFRCCWFSGFKGSSFHCLHMCIIIFSLSHLGVLVLLQWLSASILARSFSLEILYMFCGKLNFQYPTFSWLSSDIVLHIIRWPVTTSITGLGTSTNLKCGWGFKSANMLIFLADLPFFWMIYDFRL